MKPREFRRTVLIDARLRHERGWSDARILNMSSRGLLVRATGAPARGSYVEICRGTHRIVARVVWADQDRFGARAQDAIALDAIASGADVPPPAVPSPDRDRRRQPRGRTADEGHDENRRRARRAEFLTVTAFGCLAAFFAFDTVRDTLSKPLGIVEASLGGAR